MARFFALLVGAFLQAATVALAVSVVESSTLYTFSNPLVSFDVVKTTGYIRNLTFNGTDYLGPVSGNAGQLYTDFPSAVFAITNNASSQIVSSPTGDWAGIVLTDNATDVGTLVQRSWFLRESETGLHSFLRLGYYNTSGPALGSLGESRTMFRPNSPLWTYLVTNGNQWAPAPGAAALADEIQVQDATWYLGQTPDDPYVVQEADYWTKYQFADNQTNKAHGLYSPPSGDSNTSYGAWWVVNQKDTFFGGPLHIDLMVDGIIYNKQSTSHGGATSPNITAGFDRTFGPQFLYFNQGANATLHELLADAEQYADPEWNSAFYDEIAPYVVGYAPSSVRGTFSALIHLPCTGIVPGTQPMAVLAANGVHFQDDAFDPTAYQYWAPLDATGRVNISRVKEGTYRLTVYADGIFGDFTLDGVVVRAGQNTHVEDTWVPESAPGGYGALASRRAG
ncbi:Galactose mutarotase-like protein [Mycena chlorophos]|uniref:Galactose mutarotase-like protein n=1 Tax=Mycena chlorophos TaxID=658473 RepID=A0A8H6TPV3_MYCCL|nr:Galactose mutarotase-like protein [Mycena chlorophos]